MSIEAIAERFATARGVSTADLLRVYDPTIDPDAEPAFLPDDTTDSFVRLPDAFSWVDRVHVRDGVVISWGTGIKADLPNLHGKDFRVLLNGRMVRHAFEASRHGGWVRFLAPGPDGNPYSYKSVTHQAKWGRVEDDEQGGAVTGLAFGTVEWMVSREALERTPGE